MLTARPARRGARFGFENAVTLIYGLGLGEGGEAAHQGIALVLRFVEVLSYGALVPAGLWSQFAGIRAATHRPSWVEAA